MSLIITSLDLSFLFGKMKTKISTFLWVFVKMRNDMWTLLLPNRGKQVEGIEEVWSGGTGSCLDWISALHASCSIMSYKSLNIKHCLCEHRVGTRGNQWQVGQHTELETTICRNNRLDCCLVLPQEHADLWGWDRKGGFQSWSGAGVLKDKCKGRIGRKGY